MSGAWFIVIAVLINLGIFSSIIIENNPYKNIFKFINLTLIVLLIYLLVFMNPIEYTYDEKIPVYSLEDNITTSGYFSLFGGNIDGHLYYFFFIKTEEGALLFKQIRAGRVKILEQNTDYAYLYNEVKVRKFTRDIFSDKINMYTNNEEVNANYIIVPKGTVIKKYNIDLK